MFNATLNLLSTLVLLPWLEIIVSKSIVGIIKINRRLFFSAANQMLIKFHLEIILNNYLVHIKQVDTLFLFRREIRCFVVMGSTKYPPISPFGFCFALIEKLGEILDIYFRFILPNLGSDSTKCTKI